MNGIIAPLAKNQVAAFSARDSIVTWPAGYAINVLVAVYRIIATLPSRMSTSSIPRTKSLPAPAKTVSLLRRHCRQ
jgi:hypothetical protein